MRYGTDKEKKMANSKKPDAEDSVASRPRSSLERHREKIVVEPGDIAEDIRRFRRWPEGYLRGQPVVDGDA